MAYQLNINWPEFLEKYWQKQPVVLKNAFPDFVDPITPDELAGLAMEPEVDSRLVSLKNGKWQASNGPFEHFCCFYYHILFYPTFLSLQELHIDFL